MAYDVRERADELLGWLTEFWEAVPSRPETSKDWTEDEWLDFAVDVVPSKENHFYLVERFWRAGQLTEDQAARFAHVRELKGKHSALLDSLIDG